ncbi:MAG: TIGR04282 family arsenosugar biosynthesis glycosyltransferase [Alphaproteobacteria bacterium]
MARPPVLIMFARAPYLGTVKKRLAAAIGPVAARAFYVYMTKKVLTTVSSNAPWQTVMSVTPDSSAKQGRFWPPGVTQLPQGYGDLGERMESALMSFPDRPVAIIGSDIPMITHGHIQTAFAAMGRADLVLGPSPDGGYWLVGARAGNLARGLFRNVRWSSEFTLDDTLQNTGNRRVALIDELDDIDDVSDLENWRSQRS